MQQPKQIDNRILGRVSIGSENPQGELTLESNDEPLNFHMGGAQWIASNAYYDGDWKRSTEGTAFGIAFQNDDYMKILSASRDNKDETIEWNDGITLKPDGSVGIGETQPGEKLHVKVSGDDFQPIIKIENNELSAKICLEATNMQLPQ